MFFEHVKLLFHTAFDYVQVFFCSCQFNRNASDTLQFYLYFFYPIQLTREHCFFVGVMATTDDSMIARISSHDRNTGRLNLGSLKKNHWLSAPVCLFPIFCRLGNLISAIVSFISRFGTPATSETIDMSRHEISLFVLTPQRSDSAIQWELQWIHSVCPCRQLSYANIISIGCPSHTTTQKPRTLTETTSRVCITPYIHFWSGGSRMMMMTQSNYAITSIITSIRVFVALPVLMNLPAPFAQLQRS